jgi:hypothetical protein
MGKKKFTNEEIAEFIRQLGGLVCRPDQNFVWPDKLRKDYEQITTYLLSS